MPPKDVTYFDSHTDIIDLEAIRGILEMDDDGDREFSKPIIYDWFDGAVQTLSEMKAALERGPYIVALSSLSQLSHTLRGSALTIGAKKLGRTCEKIRNIARGMNEDGTESADLDEPKEHRIQRLLIMVTQAEKEYRDTEKIFRDFFEGT